MSLKACLFVIIDDIDEDYNLYSFLLNYFNKKLKDLDTFLSRTFFITRLDHHDLVKQLASLLDEHGAKKDSFNFIFLTTTNSKNDNLMRSLLEEVSISNKINLNKSLEYLKNDLGLEGLNGFSEIEPLVVYEKFLYLIKNEFFFQHMTILLNHLTLNNNIKFDHNKTQFNDQLIRTNYINADYLIYEFESISTRLVNFLNSNKHNDNNEQTRGLKFLLSKINVKDFYLKLCNSIKVVEKCLSKANRRQTCISFNGGKDCCVVLYLVYAVALRLGYSFPINLVIVNIKNSFDEMDHFIEKIIKSFYKHSIEFIVFDDTSKSLKDCLVDLKQIKPDIEYIFIGTRRSDGDYFKNMLEFAPTDADWPSYMRVNPILDWTCSEIWYFILLLKLPYCTLYDHGYTSLDNSLNTVPNKSLLKEDGSYSPAYMLLNDELERESRKKYAK